ncbi:MAG: hypothetical protein OD815_000572, partial [Candidatus Alkanophagales archaeon MCA70_species_2]|nr:hypothetical protein [Candidatus Alkanophaga liquidiphilum]
RGPPSAPWVSGLVSCPRYQVTAPLLNLLATLRGRNPKFQSLFFWTFLQLSTLARTPSSRSCFNPCFFGLLCNLKRESNGRSYVFCVSILVFWTFLQLANDGVVLMRLELFQSLFFWTFLQLDIMRLGGSAIAMGFNPCFLDFSATFFMGAG